MPLPNNNFQWRPNDLSGKTLLRYNLEAERWYNALNDVHNKQLRSAANVKGSFSFVTSVLSLVFCAVLFILLGIIRLVSSATKKLKKDEAWRNIPVTRKDYSDRLMRAPVRADYEDEDEYLDVYGAYLAHKNTFPKF
jgi:hypothetical protein